MIQIITGIIIILIGLYVFRKYPLQGSARKIAIAALFVVITAILKRLSIMVPLFGVPALKIGFESIPLMLSGMLLSPSYGFMVGVAVDIVGLIVTPTGFPFLGFTLNAILMACIPSMIVEKTKVTKVETLEKVIKITSFILLLGISIYICILDTVTIDKQVFTMHAFYKGIIVAMCVVWYFMLWFILRFMKKRVDPKGAKTFYVWVIVVIVTEITITFLLTPYWLQVMYNMPFMVSLFVRVIKQCLIVPFDIIVGYQLVKIVKKSIN